MQQRAQLYTQVALEEARKSYMNQKHGCVIVYNNKEIIAKGFNHDCSTLKTINSIHAEINALNQLRKLLKTNKDRAFIKKCKMYVVRVGSPIMDYPMKNSKPCPHCTQNIFQMGIPKVYYSTDDEFLEVIGQLEGGRHRFDYYMGSGRVISSKV